MMWNLWQITLVSDANDYPQIKKVLLFMHINQLLLQLLIIEAISMYDFHTIVITLVL